MSGFEENYHYFLHRSLESVPWPVNIGLAEAVHRYATRLQTQYAATCSNLFWNQAKDAAQTYARLPTGAMTSAALYPLG
jgi:hypothetical protein